MCKGCELETPGGNSRHFAAVSVSPFRLTIRLLCDRQTCRPTVQKVPQRTAIQLPFFQLLRL